MQCLEEIYKKIDAEEIELFGYNMASCNAATIEINDNYGIFIDENKLETKEDEFLALAHEYGHCKSGTTHKLYSPYQLIEQHENKANRAAVHEFLPIELIFDAFEHNYFAYWEIAEYLEMPEPFVIMAIEIYQREEKL